MTHYSPCVDKNIWSGRTDAKPNDYLYQIITPLNLNDPSNKNYTGYGLLGFESDTGIRLNLGNPGSNLGPLAFRKALAKLAFHGHFKLYDAGNIRCIDDELETAQTALKQHVAKLVALGLTPIVIGGGHETAWGHFQGLSVAHSEKNIAIFNLDAHFDLRPQTRGQSGTSGTPFRQIKTYLDLRGQPFHYYCAGIQPFSNTSRLFEYAKKQQVTYLLAETIHNHPNDLTFVQKMIDAHDYFYVSVCLDVFSAAIAPGVSAPQVLGITPNYAIRALQLLKQSGKVLGLDIVELSPPYDINQQTAKLAASLLLTFLSCESKPCEDSF